MIRHIVYICFTFTCEYHGKAILCFYSITGHFKENTSPVEHVPSSYPALFTRTVGTVSTKPPSTKFHVTTAYPLQLQSQTQPSLMTSARSVKTPMSGKSYIFKELTLV